MPPVAAGCRARVPGARQLKGHCSAVSLSLSLSLALSLSLSRSLALALQVYNAPATQACFSAWGGEGRCLLRLLRANNRDVTAALRQCVRCGLCSVH
eukprot:COSAG01_NODE_36486_length_517_cov_0.846890_2_plen_96_part_01